MKSTRIGLCLGMIVAWVLAPSLWAMPLHPDQIERMQRDPNWLQTERMFEEELRARGFNTPTIIPRLREIMYGHLDDNFNIIAILVDFSDHTWSTSASYFDSLLVGSATGTLRNYISEITYGNLTLVTLNMPSAVGWLRAPQTYAYYVNGQRGFGTYPRNAQRLTEDAVNLANPVVNFAPYDNDGDGYVDALFIIHSGPGYEYTGDVNDIHSHKSQTLYPIPTDGKFCYVYSMVPEYWSSPGDMTCGVYAHEMGHAAFGLPDLYDYGYDSRGLGNWSIMAGGSWNGVNGSSPAHPDAWCRIQMGAATATVVAANTFGVSIPAIETTPTIFRLWTNGTSGNQYFLVENRQRTGYDNALPGQGLLIYHVDETQSGNNNQWYPGHTTSGNYLVALEQADGAWHLEQNLNSGDAADPYPGTLTVRTFDSTTTPDSRSYAGANTWVAARNISNSAAIMTADLYVTSASIAVTYPNGGEVWYLNESRTLTWTGTGFSGNVKIEIDRNYPAGPWATLFANTPNDGSEPWTVSGTVTNTARIRVSSLSLPAVNDVSDGNFTIAQPFVALSTPDGGEEWTLGHPATIIWSSAGFAGKVKIEINRTYPSASWTTIFDSTANDGNEMWTATGPATMQARMRISSIAQPSIRDTSNGNFTILGLPPRLVHDPLGDIATGSGSVRVLAQTDDPLYISSVVMRYRRTGAGVFDSLVLTATGYGSEYGASLAGLSEGSYEYYVIASDNFGTSSKLPAIAPAALFGFDVGDWCGSEIAYDDGTAERFNYCEDAIGVMTEWAVKFGPVPVPWAMCGVRFAASRSVPDTGHTRVAVAVYAADGSLGTPGTLLYNQITGSIGNVLGGLPAGTLWANAIIRDPQGSPLIITTPEFYVSVSNLDVGDIEGFGRDANGANAHRSYFFDPCEERWFSEDDTTLSDNAYPGNRLIRVTGHALTGPVVTVAQVGNSLRLFWGSTGADSYRVYAAPALGGPFAPIGSTADTFFTVGTVDTAAVMRFFEVRSVIE